MYLYEGHMGSLYTDEEYLDYEELYCETCGDSDTCLGQFNNISEFWNLIKDECSIDGSGGWSLQYIFPFMVQQFDLPQEVTYDNYSDKSQGFCNLSDKEILDTISKYIDN